MMELDHFAVATPSLDDAAASFAGATGVQPAAGGSHPGKGTRNALVALGPMLYLAIDGPDRDQPLVDNNGAAMRRLSAPSLNVFVVRTDDLAPVRRALDRLGYRYDEERLNRFRPDGVEIAWLSVTVRDHSFGSAIPIFSQWLTDAHPATDAPQGCRLDGFTIRHPEAEKLRKLFEAVGLDVPVEVAPTPKLRLSLSGPAGGLTFETL